jgi:hypothetical protein
MKLQIKKTVKDLGFNINHFGLIGVFFLLILGLTFTQEPLLLENLTKLKFLKADNATEATMTVQGAEVPPTSESAIDNILEEKNKLSSLIDPSFSEGSVLGLSTEAQESVTEILSDKNLNTITVKEVSDSRDNISVYVDQLKLVEDYYGSILVLSAISTKDATAATEAMPLTKGIISELKAMNVPSGLVRFHRLKLMHYGVVLNMLENIATEKTSKDRAAAGMLFFEITNSMESAKTDLVNEGYFN